MSTPTDSQLVEYLALRGNYWIKRMNDTGLYMALHKEFPCTGTEFESWREALEEIYAIDNKDKNP